MKWIHKLVLVVILVSVGVISNSQSVITGEVYIDTLPAVKASVSIGNQLQLTDSTGKFKFLNLQKGRHLLHITMLGAEHYQQVIVLQENDQKELSITLQPVISSLDAIVVTGTMKAVRKSESPVAMEVYTPQFFKKNPSPSIFESLQNVNGVRPQINCSVCNTGDIHINGLEGPYTMVTIDGMPIVSSLSSVYGLFGIPSEMIERVEIVKGPASGLYGSEAIGGLINIITKSPEKAPLFSATVMTTSWKEHNIDVGLKWKAANKIQSLLGVNYFNYASLMDKNKDGFTDATLQNRISVFNKLSYKRDLGRVATLAGRYFYEDRWGGEMNWTKQFRGSDSIYGESIYTKRWELIGNYQLPVHEKMFFSFSATSHNQNSFYGVTPYMALQKIVFGQLLWNKDMGEQHQVLFGMAGRYNFYDDNSTATIDTSSKENKPEKFFIPGFFVQDEWRLSPSQTLLAGIRIDHHPVHKNIITPRIAYKISLNREQAFRINAGTGFRVVNLFTEDHAALTGSRAVEIIEELKPEKSFNVNLNYTHHLGDRSKSLLLDASLWYSHFNNQIIADYDTDPNKIIYNNLKGSAVSRGFTLNLEGNLFQRLKALAGVTLQDVSKREIVNGNLEKTIPVLTEKWSGTWSVSYSIPVKGLTIDYTGNVYGPMRLPLASELDPRKEFSPVWSIQNIQFTKWFSSKFEIFSGIKNLLNWTPAKNNPFIISRTHDPFDKNVEYDGNGKVMSTAENPFALTFDPSYIYAPNQGIRFFAGMRLKLK